MFDSKTGKIVDLYDIEKSDPALFVYNRIIDAVEYIVRFDVKHFFKKNQIIDLEKALYCIDSASEVILLHDHENILEQVNSYVKPYKERISYCNVHSDTRYIVAKKRIIDVLLKLEFLNAAKLINEILQEKKYSLIQEKLKKYYKYFVLKVYK